MSAPVVGTPASFSFIISGEEIRLPTPQDYLRIRRIQYTLMEKPSYAKCCQGYSMVWTLRGVETHGRSKAKADSLNMSRYIIYMLSKGSACGSITLWEPLKFSSSVMPVTTWCHCWFSLFEIFLVLKKSARLLV